jgi:hypothetical protein
MKQRGFFDENDRLKEWGAHKCQAPNFGIKIYRKKHGLDLVTVVV